MNETRVVESIIELLGGRERAFAIFEKEHARIVEAWDRDTDVLGRILRAHLFVEHFLGEYLSRTNPRLGSIDGARLSFAQKASLIKEDDASVRDLLPGIRHLNSIRNRIAYRLVANLTDQDAEVFLRIRMFRAMRDALFAPAVPSGDPIDILEDFSRHTGIMLEASSSEHAEVWAEAIRRGTL